MKQFIIIIIFALFASNILAQDVIIYTNGIEENVKVLEVSETEIRFKKWTNQNGPTYVKKVAEIFMIRYENGTSQTFTIQQKQSVGAISYSTYRESYNSSQPYYTNKGLVKSEQLDTPPEGPWLLYGLKVQEGINVHIQDIMEFNYTLYGWRFLPSPEVYLEFAPKQRNMERSRNALYLGLQYSFRGGTIFETSVAPEKLNYDYFCIRPAYSYEQKNAYAHLGVELGILTNSKYSNIKSHKKSQRDKCNLATFGLWMDIGAIIKEHFTIGGYFNFVPTNLYKNENRIYGSDENGWEFVNVWSPNLSFGISLGWQFNPVKLDQKSRIKL